MERVEFLRVELVGSFAAFGHQQIFKMVEADGIVSSSRNLPGELLRLLPGEIVGALTEIDSEKTDTLARSVPEDEMTGRIDDDTAVFSGRGFQRAGEVQRRIRFRMAGEIDRKPLLPRPDHLLLLRRLKFRRHV